ncbi:sugar transport [Micractinium conductrix]|uniref:Sugar transport n=1 Tax=Micractinium conductrix TaxID=554055 RepID=A0A2P6VB08_9CHLO|nr:sugar transport [Micractinium conductrix]|eukprot:PSC71282.1 sugar transport [Micractinium conductrix]
MNHKTRAVSPLVINYWMAEGVAVSGLLLLAVPPRVFSWHGVLSGVLFVASSANAVTAISLIGLSAATGVWCGTAVLVSFAWGVLVAGDEVASMRQAAAALALILAGIAGVVAASAWGGSTAEQHEEEAEEEDRRRTVSRQEGEGDTGDALLLGPAGTFASALPEVARGVLGWQRRLPAGTRAALGLLAAVLAGAIGGLILAPMVAAAPEERGIQFVPSMAVGALLVAPLVAAVLTGIERGGVSFVQATSSRAAAPGMAAGVCWNCGNAACIAAVTDPGVGLSVAMPIMQCGLFVAGLWGIFLFGEIRGGGPLALYWASGGTLVAGAALLAAAKGGA